MIVSLYQCDPEFRVYQTLQKLLEETGLNERGISTKNMVMQGHPLFELEAKGDKESDDSVFPKIGVDWLNDNDQEQDLGENHKIVNLQNPREKELIKQYQCRGGSLMDTPNVKEELKDESSYEQVSFEKFDELLSYKGCCQRYNLHNEPIVQITGWASGAHARKSAQWLFMAVKAVLPILVTELKKKYRVTVQRGGRAETNIMNMSLGHNLHGFELLLSVHQIITVYRTLPDYVRPVKPNIYANGSAAHLLN